MFFKALFSIERLNNKYLTLTTITHINLQSKKRLGYFSQIKTKISELYFVEITSQTGNPGSQSKGESSVGFRRAASDIAKTSLG